MLKIPTIGLDNTHLSKKSDSVANQYKVTTPVFGLGQISDPRPPTPPAPKPVAAKPVKSSKKKEEAVQDQADETSVETEKVKPPKVKKPVDPNRPQLKDVLLKILSESTEPMTLDDIYPLVYGVVKSPKPGVKVALGKLDNVEIVQGDVEKYRLKS